MPNLPTPTTPVPYRMTNRTAAGSTTRTRRIVELIVRLLGLLMAVTGLAMLAGLSPVDAAVSALVGVPLGLAAGAVIGR